MTTNYYEVREEIIKNLDDVKVYRNSGWASTKCPFCDANSKKRHFHININPDEAIIYKCFRATCGVSGIMNKKILRKLKIFSTKIAEEVENEAIKFNKFKNDINYIKNDKKSGLNLPPLSEKAEEYFNLRTGKNAIDYQDFLRMTSDLNKFYEMNKKYLSYETMKYVLNMDKKSDFIYFFNDTYTMVYYRELKPDGKKGKSSIINTKKNSLQSHKPYAFHNKGELKLYNPKSNTLILAEGTFDIINTFFYVGLKANAYFMATTGFAATRNIIMEFSKYYYKPYIVIASDSDAPIDYYRYRLLPKIKDRISDLVILYNKKGHDMGDIKDGIDIERIPIYITERKK